MPDYLKPLNRPTRWFAISILSIAVLVLGVLVLFLLALPFFAPNFKPKDSPTLLWIIALFGGLLLLTSWIFVRLLRNEKASNGVTVIPSWFIQSFGGFLFLCGLGFIWLNPLSSLECVSIGASMFFIGRRLNKSRVAEDSTATSVDTDLLENGRTSQTLEFSYTMTKDDYIECDMHILKKQLRRPWGILPIGCMMWIGIPAYFFPIVTISLGVCVVVSIWIWLRIIRKRFTQVIQALEFGAEGLIERITLFLTDETLTERTVVADSVARWEDMIGMKVVGDCTYIYVTEELTAIIPRHGFVHQDDYEAVRDFALKKLSRPFYFGDLPWG